MGVGCLALGFSGIGRAGFPKTRWPPIFPLSRTLRAHFPHFEHIADCFVSPFYQHNFKNFFGGPHLRVYGISVLVATSRTREQGGIGLIVPTSIMFMVSWTSAQPETARETFIFTTQT